MADAQGKGAATPMTGSADLCERLGVLHLRTAESPLFKPVFQLSLDCEHGEAMAALGRAQDARDALNMMLIEEAARRWPAHWRALRPMPYRFASWVGYDMDGRTDIGWSTSVHYRLKEKLLRLGRYADRLPASGPCCPARSKLRRAGTPSGRSEALFARAALQSRAAAQ